MIYWNMKLVLYKYLCDVACGNRNLMHFWCLCFPLPSSKRAPARLVKIRRVIAVNLTAIVVSPLQLVLLTLKL
jgi:hypothetical protein